MIFNDIETQAQHTGSFELPERKLFLSRFVENSSFKAKAISKSDLLVELFNNKSKELMQLNYSIKSSLGSPATILNSSKHTNFKYRINNFCDDYMEIVNNINSRTKLLDRIQKIKECNGDILFDSVLSKTFTYNLKCIDDSLPLNIGRALLYSYEYNIKDIKYAFCRANSNFDTQKNSGILESFLKGISFGFVPSKIWDGKYEIDGGLFFVRENGEVVLLDLTEHKKEVEKYLIDNSKFDSPSSTRYHMAEIYKNGKEYSFTLNLQLRYKK